METAIKLHIQFQCLITEIPLIGTFRGGRLYFGTARLNSTRLVKHDFRTRLVSVLWLHQTLLVASQMFPIWLRLTYAVEGQLKQGHKCGRVLETTEDAEYVMLFGPCTSPKRSDAKGKQNQHLSGKQMSVALGVSLFQFVHVMSQGVSDKDRLAAYSLNRSLFGNGHLWDAQHVMSVWPKLTELHLLKTGKVV